MPHFERLCVCAHATTYRTAAICITPVWNLSSAARRPIRHYHHQSFALARGHARQMAHGGLHHHHLHVNARRSAVISSFSNAMCRRGAAASTRANMIASSCERPFVHVYHQSLLQLLTYTTAAAVAADTSAPTAPIAFDFHVAPNTHTHNQSLTLSIWVRTTGTHSKVRACPFCSSITHGVHLRCSTPHAPCSMLQSVRPAINRSMDRSLLHKHAKRPHTARLFMASGSVGSDSVGPLTHIQWINE